MPYRHLAALGSSFAAGPGIEPIADRGAGRSGRNYAQLLAKEYGARLTDLSVSGATTATILDTEQRLLWRRFAPQIDGLPADADLVTVTAGGNDLRYAVSLLTAGWSGWFRRRPIAATLPPHGPEQVQAAAQGLARVVAAVRHRAPQARVVLVDYLTVIGPDTTYSPEVPFDDATLKGFRALGHRLNDAFQQAADESGADLVRASAFSESHAVGAAEPWVVGFRPTFRGIPAFHPNEAGMAAVARLIAEKLG